MTMFFGGNNCVRALRRNAEAFLSPLAQSRRESVRPKMAPAIFLALGAKKVGRHRSSQINGLCSEALAPNRGKWRFAFRKRHGSIPGDTPGTLTRSASEGNPAPRLRFGLVWSPRGAREVLPKPARD